MPSPIRLRVCGFWAFFDSLIAWGANRANNKDRPTYDRLDDIEAATAAHPAGREADCLHAVRDPDHARHHRGWTAVALRRRSGARLVPPTALDDPRSVAQRDFGVRPAFHRRVVGR